MSSFLQRALEIAEEAGTLLLTYFARGLGYELKSEFDLITEADRRSEELIVERLQGSYPNHSIVAEEGAGQQLNSEFCWYVDPLDGTTNFAHGFPVFCVSLALEQNGQLLVGVIHDPLRRETFWCQRGQGAFLNGRPIRVSKVSKLERALLATGFPSRKRHRDINVYFYHQLSMLSHGVRRAGSAALDLAYVACGRLDAFWEFGLNPWDVAAGVLLIQEAGGCVTDLHGQPLNLRGPHILADNGLLHAEILEVIGDIFAGNFRVPLPPLTAENPVTKGA